MFAATKGKIMINLSHDPSVSFKVFNIALTNESSGSGSEKAVELLIENAVNVNAANKYGTTALMTAAKNGNSKLQINIK